MSHSSIGRREARILAMQVLCHWEVQRDASVEVLSDFLLGLCEEDHSISSEVASHVESLVQSFWRQAETIDAAIASSATRWEFDRISPVERNVMRVAVVEFLGKAIPARVILDEAIEIAREYGGKDSPRFVNGVLDDVRRRMGIATDEQCKK